MLTVENAFLAGLHQLQTSGLDIKGNDVAVIVAHRFFCKAATVEKQCDARWEKHGPLYAKQLILECSILAAKPKGPAS